MPELRMIPSGKRTYSLSISRVLSIVMAELPNSVPKPAFCDGTKTDGPSCRVRCGGRVVPLAHSSPRPKINTWGEGRASIREKKATETTQGNAKCAKELRVTAVTRASVARGLHLQRPDFDAAAFLVASASPFLSHRTTAFAAASAVYGDAMILFRNRGVLVS